MPFKAHKNVGRNVLNELTDLLLIYLHTWLHLAAENFLSPIKSELFLRAWQRNLSNLFAAFHTFVCRTLRLCLLSYARIYDIEPFMKSGPSLLRMWTKGIAVTTINLSKTVYLSDINKMNPETLYFITLWFIAYLVNVLRLFTVLKCSAFLFYIAHEVNWTCNVRKVSIWKCEISSSNIYLLSIFPPIYVIVRRNFMNWEVLLEMVYYLMEVRSRLELENMLFLNCIEINLLKRLNWFFPEKIFCHQKFILSQNWHLLKRLSLLPNRLNFFLSLPHLVVSETT